MKVEILKDATLTVKAGQIVDIDISNVASAIRLGLVAPIIEKEPEAKPKKAKK